MCVMVMGKDDGCLSGLGRMVVMAAGSTAPPRDGVKMGLRESADGLDRI
jgi:hypothetical protein